MARLKIGLVGGGAIAQIQYLPLLMAKADEFEIGGVADLSRDLLTALGEKYRIPADRLFTDYRDLVRSDIDAVVVCSSGSHAAPAIAAAEAGKHALVEKPMATTPEEAAAMVAAAEQAGTILMIAYMKRHDPAYRYAQERVAAMSDVRFIQVNHLHPDNALHLATFDLLRFSDVPADSFASAAGTHAAQVAGVLGYDAVEAMPPAMLRAYTIVLGSMIHDIGNLHGLFGPPARVVSTEIWAEGNGISTVLEYTGDRRAVATWVDLPELPEFEETLEVYGGRERVIATFPTGFSLGAPSTVTEHGMGADGVPWRTERTWRENPFGIELDHLRECIVNGQQPMTPGAAAVHDIQLVGDIIRTYINR